VVGVTVIGLQAVGLILMIALLVIPPAAARFWTQHLPTMLLVSAGLGLLSCLIGAALSALVPRLPAGAIIVLVSGALFAVSMVCGAQRGILVRGLAARRLNLKVRRQHLLRALHELIEAAHAPQDPPDWARPVTFAELLAERSWSAAALRRELRGAMREGLLVAAAPASYVLTAAGVQAGWRVARNHRLWELFLITHADVAPSHVDRDADEVEHVLGASMIADLERQLAHLHPELAAPRSPHRIEPAISAARAAARSSAS
jgi:manganese/zinc/iron transport system permease protein